MARVESRTLMQPPWRPTKQQLLAASGKRVPDLIAPGLKVLFVGINPGLYSAAVGHHFARPGNRFWPALKAGGFTPRIISPFEEAELLALGLGITNFVERATAAAAELSSREIAAGGKRLVEKIEQFQPRVLAMLGIGAFRTAFEAKDARPGRQEQRIGDSVLWVLPNPSGLNAHYDLPELGKLFADVRRFAERIGSA